MKLVKIIESYTGKKPEHGDIVIDLRRRGFLVEIQGVHTTHETYRGTYRPHGKFKVYRAPNREDIMRAYLPIKFEGRKFIVGNSTTRIRDQDIYRLDACNIPSDPNKIETFYELVNTTDKLVELVHKKADLIGKVTLAIEHQIYKTGDFATKELTTLI